MDYARWQAGHSDTGDARNKPKQTIARTQDSARAAGTQRHDHLNLQDVSSRGAGQSPSGVEVAKAPPATPCTPQECATMVDAVEQAIKDAHDHTPDSGASTRKFASLQAWLEASGLQMPTPAAKDLQSLTDAAADSKRLRKQLEALREAELELAAREAEENAENFAVLEEENLSLAADNARLQQQLAELEALNQAASAAAEQRAQHASEQPCAGDVENRAALALQRAEHTRRLSGVFEKQQLHSLKQLDDAEEQLSAVKALTPTSRAQQKDMHRRLLQAEQEVQAAAAAAQEATQKLQQVLDEKEHVQLELQEIKQQLEAYPLAQQHAELYKKLSEAQQTMLEEKQEHQRLTSSLLEHTGRLSHKYYSLSDDYGDLQKRYRNLSSTNEQLASQLKEAHEALYELQATVQATPPAKRREQQHLVSRVVEAEQAVKSLEQDKRQLHERLLQAQAFIACLGQRGDKAGSNQQQPAAEGLLIGTPVGKGSITDAGTSATPIWDAAKPAAAAVAPAAAANQSVAEGAKAPPAAAAAEAETFGGFVTPVKGRSNPLFDLPETPGSILQAVSAPGALGGQAHLASFPVEPVSPILAAAAEALSAAAGQQQMQQIQLSAANHELQTVQQEQLGLRQEISKAKSALADIAGQLRASICGSTARSSAVSAAGSSSSSSSRSSSRAGASVKQNSTAATSQPAAAGGASAPACSGRTIAGASSSISIGNQQSLVRSTKRQSTSLPASRQGAPPHSTAGAQAADATLSSQDFTFPQLSGKAAPQGSSGSGSIHSSTCSHGPQQQQRLQGLSTAAGRQVQQHALASNSISALANKGKAAAGAASTSQVSKGKGSFSLDDLIRDAESVSLEYGMSPQLGAVLDDTATTSAPTPIAVAQAAHPVANGKTVSGQPSADLQPPRTAAEAAARNVALALIQRTLTQESGCSAHGTAAAAAAANAQRASEAGAVDYAGTPVQVQQQQQALTPHSVAGSTRDTDDPSPGMGWQQQQSHQQPVDEMLLRHQLAECLADTPGSASSSAGGAVAAVAARLWLQQQTTPVPMMSLEQTPSARPVAGIAAAESAVRTASSAARPVAEPTAAGDASPLQLAATPPGMEGYASNYLLQPSPESGISPGVDVSEQRSLVTPSYATPTAVANQRAVIAGLFAADEAAADDATSGAKKEDGCNESVANMPLQWQQLTTAPAGQSAAADDYRTPAAGISVHNGRAPARQPIAVDAGETLAGSSAGVAAWTPPMAIAAEASEALQSAAAALLASISPAGLISPGKAVPVHILKQMTPEWLKDLRQRCQQGTVQVQELRKQMGLATPEAAAGSEAGGAYATPTPPAAAAAASTSACHSACAPARPDAHHFEAHAAAIPCGSSTAKAPAEHEATPEGAVAGDSGAKSICSQIPHSTLSQASSRSNLDKLRRRAIAQASAAAAAAAGDHTPMLGADVAAAAAASYQELERTDSAGSLVQYMQCTNEHKKKPGSVSASIGGTRQLGCEGASPLPHRPGCPTPGSAYSASSTSAASSPDLLLAGLNSSRALAKQLQEQLQQHLEKTTSLPNMPKQSCAAVVDGPGLPAATAATAGDDAAADTTPVQASRISSRLSGPAAADSSSPGMLPDASPITPGAVLNASAESRMLSPSVQLDQVFEASVAQTQQAEAELEAGSINSYSSRQRSQPAAQQEATSSLASSQGSISCGSSSLITLSAAVAITATQEPQGDGAVTAHPLPAMSSVSTSATSTERSVRAHQLSSVPAGTHISTGDTHHMQSHTPCSLDSAHAHPSGSQCTAETDPSLGSWVGSQAAAAAVGAPGQDVNSHPVELTPGASGTTAGRGADAVPGGIADNSDARQAAGSSSHTVPQAQYVSLGDSPSSTRTTSGTTAAAAGGGPGMTAAEGSQAFSAGTPSSCCTSEQVPGVNLGSSPDGMSTGAMEVSSAIADVASENVNAESADLQQQVHAAAQPAAATTTAAQPAASSCTDISSCRFATPAMDFGTPGCSSNKQEIYFTGLQHTSRSVAGRPNGAHEAAEVVAFGGFQAGTGSAVTAGRVTSSGLKAAVPAAAPAEDENGTQNLLLKQLLETPSSSCTSVAGSPAWATVAAAAPGSSNQSDPVAPDTATSVIEDPVGAQASSSSAPAAATGNSTCSRGSQTPVPLASGTVGSRADAAVTAAGEHMKSPTLSDLGFIDASTLADFNAVQQVQQQQQQGSQGSSDDLTGMTFEQRLELLCADTSSDSRSPSPPAAAGTPGGVGTVSRAECVCIVQTPVLPAHLVCQATQTSPLLVDAATQRWPARNVETQVTPKPSGGGHTVTPASG